MGMKLYKWNNDSLNFERAKWRETGWALAFAFCLIAILFLIVGHVKYKTVSDENSELLKNEVLSLESLEDNEKIIIINEGDEFTQQKLVDYLLELNVKFPDIVFAQAMYESARWESHIWKENNNMFGMKVATSRPTTNKGEQHGHAVYDNWRDCVMDYAIWQSYMTKGINNREDYMAYLKRVYAEGTYHAIRSLMKEAQTRYPELCVKRYPRLERVIIKPK